MTVCRSRWLHTHSQFWLNYLKNIMWRSESRARFNPKLKVRKSLKRSLADEPLITFLFKTWSKDVRNVKVRVTWLQTPDESQSLFLSLVQLHFSFSHYHTHTHTLSQDEIFIFPQNLFRCIPLQIWLWILNQAIIGGSCAADTRCSSAVRGIKERQNKGVSVFSDSSRFVCICL